MTPTRNSQQPARDAGGRRGRREEGGEEEETAQTLHGEQDEESYHQTEQTHGLGQSEPQDGVGEQLLLQRRVPEREHEKVLQLLHDEHDIRTGPWTSIHPSESIYLDSFIL